MPDDNNSMCNGNFPDKCRNQGCMHARLHEKRLGETCFDTTCFITGVEVACVPVKLNPTTNLYEEA